MTRALLGRMLPAVLVLTVAAPAGAQPSFRWWRSAEVQKDLGLTPDQVTRLDGIFQGAIERQHKNKDVLDRLEAQLSSLIEANADEPTVVQQVDKVEAARGVLNKERTLMLLHMRQVLTPQQRTIYTARVEQWQREHPRPHGDVNSRTSSRGPQPQPQQP
jgi:Spy/CpxP family protein refolding chaperone